MYLLCHYSITVSEKQNVLSSSIIIIIIITAIVCRQAADYRSGVLSPCTYSVRACWEAIMYMIH